MKKFEQLQKIESCGIVAIIRTADASVVMELTSAIVDGGVDVVEITMTTPNVLKLVDQISSKYGDKILIGTGSILDAESARVAILSGAEFIVSPIVKAELIELCNRYGKVVMPGAFTPTEVLSAWEMGADYVKLFPSNISGSSYVKDLKAPMPQISLIPAGGINLENAAKFIDAGASALGIGSLFVNKSTVENRQFDRLSETTKTLVEIVKTAKSSRSRRDN